MASSCHLSLYAQDLINLFPLYFVYLFYLASYYYYCLLCCVYLQPILNTYFLNYIFTMSNIRPWQYVDYY